MIDLFGQTVERDILLRERFLEPPFTILDTKQKSWQARKRLWVAKGIRSEESREDIGTLKNGFTFEKYGREGTTSADGQGTSIFDPALCELMYRWFCPPGGKILDPFAGGSVRGIVAHYLGFDYTGIELRGAQVLANYKNAEELLTTANQPRWHQGDSYHVLDRLYGAEMQYDMIFSCPPYMDLEVYSDDPADLSNMSDTDFKSAYRIIIERAVRLLKPNSFAVFVVGDLRDKQGYLRRFPDFTKEYFVGAGAQLYNEAILIQPYGTAMLRANKVYGTGKKLVKVHENVLVFFKGDPRLIKAKFAQDGSTEETTGDSGGPEGPLEDSSGTGDDEQYNGSDFEPFG